MIPLGMITITKKIIQNLFFAGEVMDLDAETGGRVFSKKIDGEAISALAWHPSGNRIAAATRNGKVKIISGKEGKVLLEFSPFDTEVVSLAWSNDGPRDERHEHGDRHPPVRVERVMCSESNDRDEGQHDDVADDRPAQQRTVGKSNHGDERRPETEGLRSGAIGRGPGTDYRLPTTASTASPVLGKAHDSP